MSTYQEETDRFEFKRDPYNDMLIGQDGCHYTTESEAMYYAQLGLCGCGNPETVHEFILHCLKSTRDDSEIGLDYEKIEKLVAQNIATVAQFILHFLDQKRLTEHGSSVYGSWLTGRGKQFVEAGVLVEIE